MFNLFSRHIAQNSFQHSKVLDISSAEQFCRVIRLTYSRSSAARTTRSTRPRSRSPTTTGTRPIEAGSPQPGSASTSGRYPTRTWRLSTKRRPHRRPQPLSRPRDNPASKIVSYGITIFSRQTGKSRTIYDSKLESLINAHIHKICKYSASRKHLVQPGGTLEAAASQLSTPRREGHHHAGGPPSHTKSR